MTEGNDAFERNLERLIGAAAPPPPDAARARREFLARLEGRSDVRWGRRIAMAASLLAAAAILYSAFAPKAPAPPVKEARVQEPSPPQVPEPPARAPEAPTPRPVRPEAAPGPSRAPVVARGGGFTLSCTLPPKRTPGSVITLEGKASLPDRLALSVSLNRMVETYEKGRLVPRREPSVNSATPEVEEKRFSVQAAWTGPGRYVAKVELSEAQREDVKAALKKLSWKSSSFEFDGWGDELVGTLGVNLSDLDALADEALRLIAKLEKLAEHESDWVKERKKINERSDEVILTKQAEELLKEVEEHVARLDASEAKALYPACFGEIVTLLDILRGNARNFHYEKGKFAGAKTYHGPVKTLRGDALDFETAKKYLAEAPAIAGREMALWIVKDLRRTRAESRPALAETLKTCAAHAGIAGVSDRLSSAKLEDLDALEAEIRAGK